MLLANNMRYGKIQYTYWEREKKNAFITFRLLILKRLKMELCAKETCHVHFSNIENRNKIKLKEWQWKWDKKLFKKNGEQKGKRLPNQQNKKMGVLISRFSYWKKTWSFSSVGKVAPLRKIWNADVPRWIVWKKRTASINWTVTDSFGEATCKVSRELLNEPFQSMHSSQLNAKNCFKVNVTSKERHLEINVWILNSPT